MNPEGGVITGESIPEMTFKVEGASEDLSSATVRFISSETDNYQEFQCYYDYSQENYYISYRSSSSINPDAEEEYVLESIRLHRLGADMTVEVENPEQYSFKYRDSEYTDDREDKEEPVVKSIKMDKNTEDVKAGDVISITVEAEDDVALDPYGTLYLYASADNIESYWEWIDLTYSEETGLYTGSFEITEETYPCEWYIDSVDIKDEAGNYASASELLADYPYYVNVVAGNTFVNPVYEVNYNFQELNPDGYWDTTETKTVKVERRATLREAGIELPQIESRYEGFTFTGWEANALDEPIIRDTWITISATYDKQDGLHGNGCDSGRRQCDLQLQSCIRLHGSHFR